MGGNAYDRNSSGKPMTVQVLPLSNFGPLGLVKQKAGSHMFNGLKVLLLPHLIQPDK